MAPGGIVLLRSVYRVLTVAGLPGSPLRPQELARKLKLNKDLTSRLLRALSEQDRLVAMHLMRLGAHPPAAMVVRFGFTFFCSI